MVLSLPQDILDRLTDVPMPRFTATRRPERTLDVAGQRLPVYRSEALVLGSGAAGLRAAVEMKRRGVDVIVATQAVFGGTSACSGSDKQTLHTAADSGRGDDFNALADALGAGGGMDEDTAYVEAVGSLTALNGLRYLGLPIPVDPYGAVLRYQTDHDEAGRATSCGPRTSRLMVKVLAEEAERLGIPVLNRAVGVAILKSAGPKPRVVGLLATGLRAKSAENPYGLMVFSCGTLVLAAGGPGELYRDSVYPHHCYGSLGLALEAGIEAVNLTESQFGIGTRREEFPWNLSGTYVQAIPYIYSRDSAGTEYNFLADYFRTTQELASNIFRKGYQWPFHASRMLNFGSSLVDLAIFEESRRGRTILMDFNRNPEMVPGDLPFSLDRLDADVHAYLANNDALFAQPIDRLRQMNPLAIELYKRGKRDIAADPLPFNVNNQHMNGGVHVDIWGRTSLPGCYAVGEAAGTHGVTRPGGAALNAGQVMGLRCAEHIAARRLPDPEFQDVAGIATAAAGETIDWLGRCATVEGRTIARVRREVQARMSDKAGFICQAAEVADARIEADALAREVRDGGIALASPGDAVKAILWRQMALASSAVLSALDTYVARGGGSRGARALCTPDGAAAPDTRLGALDAYRFRAERKEDRAETIVLRLDKGQWAIEFRPLRRRDRAKKTYFEKYWGVFLQGQHMDDA